MNEQLRPVDGRHGHELDLLTQVAEIVRQARQEFAANCPTAARLEILQAQRLLDRAYSGEAV